MKFKTKIFYGTFGALVLSLTIWAASAGQPLPTPAMVGHWEGTARIVVSWCHQTNLPVALDFHADGSVTGKIGDATLKDGRLDRNRGWLGRKLSIATDYIVKGLLDGPVVSAEAITRSGVSIPLNFDQNSFIGGVHTSGSKFGGKAKGILSASSLILRRTPTP